MAKELFNSDFYTLPEQVQINKEDIETNTSDITKLKEDIGKIKPNAWEERKFKVQMDDTETPFECSTYNPITNKDFNPLVNVQMAFTDKDIYGLTDSFNAYSFAFTSSNLGGRVGYLVCGDPSLTFQDVIDLMENTSKVGILFLGLPSADSIEYHLYITSTNIKTDELRAESLTIGKGIPVDKISTDDDKSNSSILTAGAVDLFYLKKTDASNTYLTKTDASNTYVTKQEYEKRIDEGTITFTSQGWEKLRTITDTEGQTITLRAGVDYTEHIQITWNHDAILQFRYDNNFIYKNVYLHPNSSLDDLDDPNGHNSQQVTFYTGQAIFTLATQSDALFNIIYQEGVSIILHLITTI